MAVTVLEAPESRELEAGRSNSASRRYIIYQTEADVGDEEAARDALIATAPASIGLLVVGNARVSETERADFWLGTVEYVPPGKLDREKDPPATNDRTFNFDTGGGTQHVTQSKENKGRYGQNGDTAPDFKGAINVTDSSIEGCDIVVPVYNWSETHYKPDSQVTLAYRGALFGLTGKVNSGAFKGFAAGECLFLGASGSKRGSADWEITFRFASSPNRTNITDIPTITVASKKGWEYLWIRYHDVKDETAKMLVKRPCAAYVERVYDEGDFSGLGIGT